MADVDPTVARFARAVHAHRPAPGWEARAGCVGLPVELFYVDDPGGRDPYRDAAAVCARCPVLADCRAATAHGRHDDHGYRGGMSPNGRRELRAAWLALGLTWSSTCRQCRAPIEVTHYAHEPYCSESCRLDGRTETHRRSNLRHHRGAAEGWYAQGHVALPAARPDPLAI